MDPEKNAAITNQPGGIPMGYGVPPPQYSDPSQQGYSQQGSAPPQQGYPPPQQGYPPPQQQGYAQPQQGFVQTAPGQPQIQMMVRPPPIPGVPAGLEYLTGIDQLIVKQIKELLEIFTGFETKNKYRILNSMGQQVFFAAEESDLCMRLCCGPGRGFTMHITDNAQQEVIRVVREFKCCAGCCWCANADCCAFELEVQAPPGQVVGYVRQEQSAWKPCYSIRDTEHTVIAKVHGPCCVCNAPCCGDVEFPVLSTDDTTQIGRIAKQWTGALAEYFTDADTFSVSFPVDMDVRMKATMIGAVFLIDFMYFEKQNNNN